MAAWAGTEFNDLSKLLFHCLGTLNPTFNPKTYLDDFEVKKTNVDRVNFVYKDIKKYPNVFAKFTKDKKDDTMASIHADGGKMKFNSENYWGALEDYTRLLATAKGDSCLALGYSRRAECFLKLNMPNKCLEEIERASTHVYPNELSEELIEMKKQAKELKFPVRSYCEPVPSSESNSSVQCANDCVKIACTLKFGRYVVATRDIEIGEVISIEKPYTCVLTTDRLNHCHHCLNLCYNPIPCKTCTVALFCNEICRDKARSSYHKYECPILLTICYRALCEFGTDETLLLALKIALVSKDDYPQLKTFHQQKNESYRSDRYKEVHCLESKAAFSLVDLFHQAILTALVFELLWDHTSFFSGIFSSVDTEDTFKEVMLLQLQSGAVNATKIYEYVHKFDFSGTSNFGLGAYPFFSLFPHSCCANVMKTYHQNTMVLRALNTIKEGERCFVNRFGLRYDALPKSTREQFFSDHQLPGCSCTACKEDWKPNLGNMEELCESLDIDQMQLGDIVKNVIGTDVDKANNLLVRLIAQLKECEEFEPSGNALALKNLIAHCYVIFGNKKLQFDVTTRDIVLAP